MHEASITDSVMATVLDTIAHEGIEQPVTAVHLKVGVCQGIVPDSMEFFFDMAKVGTLLEGARLVVETQGVVARCNECKAEHVLDAPVLYCPECGSPMEMICGDEILITSIEVADE